MRAVEDEDFRISRARARRQKVICLHIQKMPAVMLAMVIDALLFR